MAARAVFPLRWRNERLKALTAEVASRLGISQNELIEQAIEHEVVAQGAMLSEDMRATADRLAALTSEQYQRIQQRSLERFAAGEGLAEPLVARQVRVAAMVNGKAAEAAPAVRDVTSIYSSARARLA